MRFRILLALLGLGIAPNLFGVCKITEAIELNDVVSEVVGKLDDCPVNVFEFKDALRNAGLDLSPAMVANRGRHNPKFGSFSVFEIGTGKLEDRGWDLQPGHFYFGHFTRASNGRLVFDQSPRPGKLLIELIAWDFEKEMFNFYELVGGRQTTAQWHFRGDSRDAFLDNENLHRQENASDPVFGSRMRCSACHTSGGPIMKELAAPHNDWWTEQRPLSFGGHVPDEMVQQVQESLIDAAEFSSAVVDGISRLDGSETMKSFKEALGMQEQLRPLFCTTEINLVSDEHALSETGDSVTIPADYLVSSLLLGPSSVPTALDRELYVAGLEELNFVFLETVRLDADHAWLAPVKGYSDYVAISSLVDSGVIDEEFVADVLAVDMTSPLFSNERCSLLKLIPNTSTDDWQEKFIDALEVSSFPSATELLRNLTDESRDQSFHKTRAQEVVDNFSVESLDGMKIVLDGLHERRKSVFDSQIYMNPLGQILEQPSIDRPGFRVVFPTRR